MLKHLWNPKQRPSGGWKGSPRVGDAKLLQLHWVLLITDYIKCCIHLFISTPPPVIAHSLLYINCKNLSPHTHQKASTLVLGWLVEYPLHFSICNSSMCNISWVIRGSSGTTRGQRLTHTYTQAYRPHKCWIGFPLRTNSLSLMIEVESCWNTKPQVERQRGEPGPHMASPYLW